MKNEQKAALRDLLDGMLVEVTQARIDKGMQGEARLCPVAIALGDLSNDKVKWSRVAVERKSWKAICKYEDSQFLVTGINSDLVMNFIDTYDDEGKDEVKPISFPLSGLEVRDESNPRF